jgi:hypothetical protein
MTAVQEFAEVFRSEHRQVRDLLLAVVGRLATGSQGGRGR